MANAAAPSNVPTYLVTMCVIYCIVPLCTWLMGLVICGFGIPTDASEAVKRVACVKVMRALGSFINCIACLIGCYYMYTIFSAP